VLLSLSIGGIAAQDDTLTVDADNGLGPINPYIYGVSHGPWAFVGIGMWPTVEASGITFLRFPGGRWGDEFDLKPHQIDHYIAEARQWNAEPSIHTRLNNGGTPEQAADLVRYVNVEKEYNVRYWIIGNEPDLYEMYHIGEGTGSLDSYDIEKFNADWRAMAEAMLAVDPNILLMGPEVSQYPPTVEGDAYTNVRREWVREFLKVNGDLVDIVSIHRYPFPRGVNSVTTIDDLRANPPEWDVMIPNLRALIRETIGRDLPIAVTEINSHWNNTGGGEATPDSFYHAIWWADVLGRMVKQDVDIVAYFLLGEGGSGHGLLTRYEPLPTYYVYPMYKLFGRELVEASSLDPNVTIYAAKREDGTLTLMVINLGTEESTKRLALGGITPGGAAQVWRLDPDHNAEQIEDVELSDGVEITLPGQSMTLYVIPAA
jgi:hypothetical protein